MNILNSMLFGGIGALIVLKLVLLAVAAVLLVRVLPQPARIRTPVRATRRRPAARS